MPATGLSRRYHELRRGRKGRITLAALCILAHFYFVSVEVLARRLEEVRLLPSGPGIACSRPASRFVRRSSLTRELWAQCRLTSTPSSCHAVS